MRAYEFRGLDRNDGLVKEIERIDFKNELVLFVGEDAWVDFSNVEIMQFTGLYDKNGVKIFEGDILHLYGKDTINEYDWKAVVEFGNPNGLYSWGYQLNPITEFGYNADILAWIDVEECGIYAEVIGNIHEKENLWEQNV